VILIHLEDKARTLLHTGIVDNALTNKSHPGPADLTAANSAKPVPDFSGFSAV
jgi:hypothetical protein